MTAELFRQIRVIDPVTETDRTADVLIADGFVQAIDQSIDDVPDDAIVTEGANLVLAPGLVDLYSHSGEPGFESRETLDSLRQAAIAGGFTRVVILPDTDPPIDNPAIGSKLRIAPPPPRLFYWGAITQGVKGQQMSELADFIEAGAESPFVGFADGCPLQNSALLRRVLEYGQLFQRPIALWCCDVDLRGNGIAREGLDAIRLGLPVDPAMSEAAPLAALLECVEATGTAVHLMRISTARSVELVRSARQRGLPITASTTWMHLLLDTRSLDTYDPSLRLEPSLGTAADREALIHAIADGTIDAIAIDHSPFTYEEKTVAFAEAPPGAIGLELALPLLWEKLVVTGDLSAMALWRSLSTNPARCLQQTPPALQVGQAAELIVFDPSESWQVNRSTLRSLSLNTPWLGKSIAGKVMRAIV